MSQFDWGTMDPTLTSGTGLASDLNSFRDAVLSLHSGTSRPAYVVAGTLWRDTTANPNLIKLFDGTSDVTLAKLNTSTHTLTWVVSGGQLEFPASQNASTDSNTLDDYEEGTFTPGLAFGGASVGMTYSSQVGTYVKIGKSVICQMFITLSAKGSSVGALTMTGLPFTSGAVGVACVEPSGWAALTGLIVQGYLLSSSTSVSITKVTQSTGAESACADTNLSATSTVRASVNYIANS